MLMITIHEGNPWKSVQKTSQCKGTTEGFETCSIGESDPQFELKGWTVAGEFCCGNNVPSV
jgi:hypothetical protein